MGTVTSLEGSEIEDLIPPDVLAQVVDRIGGGGSDLAPNEFGKIIDVVWANEGQFLATTNKSVVEMVRKWDQHLVTTAVRRIGKRSDAPLHQLHEPEVRC
jgi:hypothetical protein